MVCYLQGSPADLKVPFSDAAGNPADPTGQVTVQVLRADGTILVPSGTAATKVSTGVFKYTLSPAQTALLDTLAVRWTATFGGVTRTYPPEYAEIVGGYLFSSRDAANSGLFVGQTSDTIAERRTYAEQELENALGYAMVPRYAYEQVTGNWTHGYGRGSMVRLAHPFVRAVRAVTVDGVALTSGELAQIRLDGQYLWTGAGFPSGWGGCYASVVVGYEHGRDAPPFGGARAGMLLAADSLPSSASASVDPRAERLVTDDGTLVFADSGGGGATFGIPVVDRFVEAHRLVAVA